MNAIYLDHDATLFDPVDGVRDLAAGAVRFVGKPDDRIEEDFLRILRFFRFSARYGNGALDPAGLEACVRKRKGLATLSLERVHKELFQLLEAPFACPVLDVMTARGVFAEILGASPRVDVMCRLAGIERQHGFAVDPVRRLAALVPCDAMDPDGLKHRLRLSNVQAAALAATNAATGILSPGASDQEIAVALYEAGRTACLDGALVAWASRDATKRDDGWVALCARISDLQVPEFPVAGRDLVARGIEEGPGLGDTLQRLEEHWLQQGCRPSKAELLRQL